MKNTYLYLLCLLFSPLVYSWPTTINTTEGTIEGYTKEHINTWQGLDYAQAPVGPLRWQSPKPPISWEGVKLAKTPAVFKQFGFKGVTGSEASLTLDIYRPDTSAKQLPVMFYIHGGNNQTGSSTELTGQHLVDQLDMVLVSINYRLGVMGFNPLPAVNKGDEKTASGNYGLLDIAAALDWVHANIGEFGGDNNNITVAGFSAGGRDVMAMLISPLFENKFSKAISFSGGLTLSDKQMSAKVFAKVMAPLVVEDGIKEDPAHAEQWLMSDNKEVREYLYSLDADRLAKLMPFAGIRMAKFPHLYTDGHVLPKEGFSTTRYNSVPLILLSGRNEFAGFAKWSGMFKGKLKNADSTLWNQYRYASQYGNAFYHQFNTHHAAEALSENYRAPVYIASIAVAGDPMKVGEQAADTGPYHGIWKPLLAHQYGFMDKNLMPVLKQEGAKKLSRSFRAYLASFIHTGTPKADNQSEWPVWEPSGLHSHQQLVFDADKHQAVIYPESSDYARADIIRLMESDKSLSEEQKQQVIKSVLNGRWFSASIDEHFGNPSLW